MSRSRPLTAGRGRPACRQPQPRAVIGGRPDACWLMRSEGRHQEKTGSVAALREAKELSTPVLARPRVASQDSPPAITAPEMVVKMMYASLSPPA